MRDETVARIYADALLQVAEARGLAAEVGDELASLVRLEEEEPTFRLFLESPRVSPPERRRVLREILQGRVSAILQQFLLVTVDKGRQDLLPLIRTQYESLREARANRITVIAETALPLDEPLRQALRAALGRALGKEVRLTERADPSLLGGLVLRVGDRLLDGSLRARLAALRGRLEEIPVRSDRIYEDTP